MMLESKTIYVWYLCKYIMYFSNYLSRIKNKIHRIRLGDGRKNKLRILCVEFLRILPRNLRVKNFLEAIVTILCMNVIVKIESIKYVVLDLCSLNISCDPNFEPFMSTWLKPKQSQLFMDIGAHIGKYALSVAKTVGKLGKVIAIEPHPTNYQFLQRNIAINNFGNIIALNVACWDRDGILKLFIGRESGLHSLKSNYGLGKVEVKAMSGDHILEKTSINRLDWVKIDAEGAECEVLHGLKKTIQRYKPKVIVEVRPPNMSKIKKLMEKHSYGLIAISSPQKKDMVYLIGLPLNNK